ncbi:phage tail sheath C-terminal domain-containing protein [Peptostreptococcus equinus]|uniref:Phage tail sheath subtilisin-like domain-containing protein n=1 Tax=Peptostreptococcus equinus TaxID=3003601 RepID=A0ABY7JQ53_9FIRM|nr:phage tail sheath C-terminal domain-containing protein [Peptostreptococcus sp. CBA3647]WAW15289.1 phage tail sheath subtilisin-like domain-containing protein [Peptostreptococcus sp. CBA3647]
MGIPELKISFMEAKNRDLEGATTGVVLLILKETVLSGFHEYLSIEDVKEEYTPTNLQYIKDAFMGNVQDIKVGVNNLEARAYTPSKVIVCIINESFTLDKALEECEGYEFNYMCMPDATDEVENPKLIAFIDSLPAVGYSASLIINTKTPSNKPNIIEFYSTGDVTTETGTYKANQLLPFIAGLCAGTPLTQSITYAVVPFVIAIPKQTSVEISASIDGGKLVLIKKGGVVRIARGVTSLTSTSGAYGSSFKKIKLVRTYNAINNLIKGAITNFYIGKLANTYDNKVLLISEVSNYLESMAKDGIIDKKFLVDIDVEAHKTYLKSVGINYSSFTEQELREANTGSKVFLKIRLRGVDAMEDFYINIVI